jgi:hypothetical protein
MSRLIAHLPEKFTMRASTEQRKFFITLGWFLGSGGKYGPAIRFFMDRYMARFLAELSETDKARWDEHYEMVEKQETFANPLIG